MSWTRGHEELSSKVLNDDSTSGWLRFLSQRWKTNRKFKKGFDNGRVIWGDVGGQ